MINSRERYKLVTNSLKKLKIETDNDAVHPSLPSVFTQVGIKIDFSPKIPFILLLWRSFLVLVNPLSCTSLYIHG
jgi:hypothetical protein